MNWALTTMASGKFLWAVLLLAGVALGILAVKAPAIYRMVTAPFRALWAKAKTWKYVAWVLTKVGNTLAWKWLESHQYDPPARPLTWYMKAGFVIMVLWLASGYVLFDHARKTAPLPSMAFIGTHIDSEWKSRALQCETKAADAFTREPVVVEPLVTTVPTLDPTPPAVKGKDVKGAGKGHKKTFSLLDAKTW